MQGRQGAIQTAHDQGKGVLPPGHVPHTPPVSVCQHLPHMYLDLWMFTPEYEVQGMQVLLQAQEATG